MNMTLPRSPDNSRETAPYSPNMRLVVENLAVLPRSQSFNVITENSLSRRRQTATLTTALDPTLPPATRNTQNKHQYHTGLNRIESASDPIAQVNAGGITLDETRLASLPGGADFLRQATAVVAEFERRDDLKDSDKINVLMRSIQAFNAAYTSLQAISFENAAAEFGKIIKEQATIKQVENVISQTLETWRQSQHRTLAFQAVETFRKKYPELKGITAANAERELKDMITAAIQQSTRAQASKVL